MVNAVRGEAELIVNGQPRKMVLTLGALAEIENEIGVGISEVGQQMESGKMGPLSTMIFWMLKAGGWTELCDQDRVSLQYNVTEAAQALKEAMNVSGFGGTEGNV